MLSGAKRSRTSEDSDGIVKRKPRKRGSVAGAALMSPDDVVDGHKFADEHISTVDALVLSEARHDEVSASLSSVVSRFLSEQPEIELSSIYVDAAVGV